MSQNLGQVLSLAKEEKENLKLGTTFLEGVTEVRTQKKKSPNVCFLLSQ